jgi:hypothetical protein
MNDDYANGTDYRMIYDQDAAASNPETYGSMAKLVGNLLKARDTAHMWHWKVKSFSMHMALGELYDQLLELTDELFEMYMGRYGTDAHIELSDPNPFSENDPLEFISQLDSYLEYQHDVIPQDKFIVNHFETIQALVSTTKYKLVNLK